MHPIAPPAPIVFASAPVVFVFFVPVPVPAPVVSVPAPVVFALAPLALALALAPAPVVFVLAPVPVVFVLAPVVFVLFALALAPVAFVPFALAPAPVAFVPFALVFVPLAFAGFRSPSGTGMSTLIVIRGNSGSGKSSAAQEVRRRYGRGCALVEQDYLRRILLREHDTSDLPGLAPRLITTNARMALSSGYHVVLEGILASARYRPVLRELISAHPGESHVYYLETTFAETVRRHATRPLSAKVTPEQMQEWYTPGDVLGIPGEHIIPESSTLDETVELILHTSGLLDAPAESPCPALCRHCQAGHR